MLWHRCLRGDLLSKSLEVLSVAVISRCNQTKTFAQFPESEVASLRSRPYQQSLANSMQQPSELLQGGLQYSRAVHAGSISVVPERDHLFFAFLSIVDIVRCAGRNSVAFALCVI